MSNSGLYPRMFARMLDNLIGFCIFTLPLIFITSKVGLDSLGGLSSLMTATSYSINVFLWGLVISVIYNTVFVSLLGGTLGKLLFGIRVVDKDTETYLDIKRAFYRYAFGYAFSGAFMGLGYLQILRRQDKRGWHDELFNTKVVKIGSYTLGFLAIFVLSSVALFNVVTIAEKFMSL